MSRKLVVSKSKIAGKGVYTLSPIKAGEFIIFYEGEKVTTKEMHERSKIYKKNGIEEVYFFSLEDDTILDATVYGNNSKFINHSCQVSWKWRKTCISKF